MSKEVRKLTEYQKNFIIKNYSTMKTRDMCAQLHLDYDQIHSYASNKKLKKNNPYVSQRWNGYYNELLEKRDREDYNVYDYLGKESELKVKDLYKSKYGKYHVNQNYFSIIDNEWKAYWLGFLYADGTNRIHRNTNKSKMDYVVKLTLCKEDKRHIKKFAKSIQSDAPITDRIVKFNNNTYYSSSIDICNRKMCEDLNKLGCTPNKSLTLKFPSEEQVPKNLIRHFIRGYFDGDGCIHINKDEHNVRLLFEGTEDMLDNIRYIFHKELNIKFPQIESERNSKAYHINYGKYADIELIYKYLYKDCNVYLDRKLKKFDILYCLD